MRARIRHGIFFFALVMTAHLGPRAVSAQQPAAAAPKAAPEAPALRDGQRDFDFLIGTWKYHLKRLVNPLTGSTKWIEFDGTGVCRPI